MASPTLGRPPLPPGNTAAPLRVRSVCPGRAPTPSPLSPPQSPPLLWAATDGSTPFRVHLHDSDVGHTLVLGKTGSGKSVLLALLAAQFRRYPGAQVFAFDVGYSLWALAHAAGARHYDLAAGRVDALSFQPLARIDDPAERAWAADWLETLFGLQGVTVTPPSRGRIDQRLDGGPTLLLIDEAWMALMHSLFGARVNQWLLQLRKQNAAVVLATQSPAQLAQLAHRHTIVDSCVTKIYLPNPDAGTPAQAPLYHDLGLNEREVAIITRATPKRHYYLKSPRGSRLFELGLGPVALSFLAADPGASMEETRRHLETLITTHGGDWPAARLDERGLGTWAARLRAHHPSQGRPPR